MSTPEVRLSPDGSAIAHRFPPEKHWTVSRCGQFGRFGSDGFVSEWTPLLPVSNKDGA